MCKAAKRQNRISCVYYTYDCHFHHYYIHPHEKQPDRKLGIHPMKLYGAIPCAETGTGVTFVILTSDDISLAPKVTTTGGIEVTCAPTLTFQEITRRPLLTVSNIRRTNAMETAGGICWMLEADLTPNPSCTEESSKKSPGSVTATTTRNMRSAVYSSF